MASDQQRDFEKEKRYTEIAKLYGQRYTQTQIGEMLGIDQSTVSRALKALKERWRAEHLDEIGNIQARDVELLDRLIGDARLEWDGSHDPKWLHALTKLLERKARTLGSDAPVKQDITSGGEPVAMVHFFIPTDDTDQVDTNAAVATASDE